MSRTWYVFFIFTLVSNSILSWSLDPILVLLHFCLFFTSFFFYSICFFHLPQCRADFTSSHSTSLTLLNLPLSLSSSYLSHSPQSASLTLLNLPLSLSSICLSHSPSFYLSHSRKLFLLSHYLISFHLISFHRTVPSFSPPSLPILISSYIMVSFSSSLLALIFLFSSCSQFEIFSLHPTSISRALFFSHLSHSPSYSTLLSPFLPYFPYPPSCWSVLCCYRYSFSCEGDLGPVDSTSQGRSPGWRHIHSA